MKNSVYLLKNCKKHFKLFLLYFVSLNHNEQKSFIDMLDNFDFNFWGDE